MECGNSNVLVSCEEFLLFRTRAALKRGVAATAADIRISTTGRSNGVRPHAKPARSDHRTAKEKYGHGSFAQLLLEWRTPAIHSGKTCSGETVGACNSFFAHQLLVNQ